MLFYSNLATNEQAGSQVAQIPMAAIQKQGDERGQSNLVDGHPSSDEAGGLVHSGRPGAQVAGDGNGEAAETKSEDAQTWERHSLRRLEIVLTDADVVRFFSKIDKNGPIPAHAPQLGRCHLWTGVPIKTGYGDFAQGKRKLLAHRVAFFLFNGYLDVGLQVQHKCDVRNCVNPDHLMQGTHHGNMMDMRNKGRQNRGEKVPCSLFTDEQILEIRQLYSNGQVTFKSIADRFTTTTGTIRNIVLRRSWRHIGGAEPPVLVPYSYLARGEDHHAAKLTQEGVLRIRARALSGISQHRIAREFGICQNTVSLIVRRKIWKNVH